MQTVKSVRLLCLPNEFSFIVLAESARRGRFVSEHRLVTGFDAIFFLITGLVTGFV